ncbi:MAG: DUF72 domain-containing protein [Bacteroidota bacterium]
MKFGRLATDELANIAWELPEDTPATETLLDDLPARTQPPAIYIGCSVWTDPSFVGKVYPKGTPVKDFLKIYCQHFNSVELNTTFYSIPSIEKVKKWKAVATPGFKFCPKVAQSISHRSKLDEQKRWLDIFIEAVLHFEEALGMTFMQLPPYFQPSGMEGLQKLLAHIPQGFPFTIELRHPVWFSDLMAQQELFDFLQARGIGVVITDTAGRRDVLHQTLTTDYVFIRFVGNNLHATDYERVDAWIKKLQQWIEQGLSTIYFLLHEPEKALCADLAVYMIQQLNTLEEINLAPPQLVSEQVALFPSN